VADRFDIVAVGIEDESARQAPIAFHDQSDAGGQR
jgi:hypothetical protein